jgi:hypothetical protein
MHHGYLPRTVLCGPIAIDQDCLQEAGSVLDRTPGHLGFGDYGGLFQLFSAVLQIVPIILMSNHLSPPRAAVHQIAFRQTCPVQMECAPESSMGLHLLVFPARTAVIRASRRLYSHNHRPIIHATGVEPSTPYIPLRSYALTP